MFELPESQTTSAKLAQQLATQMVLEPGTMAKMGRSTILALVVALFCHMTQYALGESYSLFLTFG